MTRIRYGSIQIGSIRGNAQVHCGNNWVVGRTHSAKVSDVVGKVDGEHNTVTGAKGLVVDDDVVDGGRWRPGASVAEQSLRE